MTWAMRRRLIILGIIAGVLGAILVAFYFTVILQAPSCTDNRQNQDEEGIDCGGSSCTYLCTQTQAAPSVRFARPLPSAPGRIDVIAYIDNPNGASAAHNLPFTVELYSADNTVLAKKEGTVDLPPSTTVPVFIANAYQGSETISRVFITFNAPSNFWYRATGERIVPQMTDIMYTGGATPRITANAVNPSTMALRDLVFVATVFDAEGNAVGASSTVLPTLAPQRTASLIFTWNAPFPAEVSRIEVIPATPLTGP